MFTADSWTLSNVKCWRNFGKFWSRTWYLFIKSPLFLIWPQEEWTRKAMKCVLAEICNIFARILLWGHISSILMSNWPQAGPTHGNPLRRRNFCPALGNHVPGTWHQTELLPIFSASTKLAKFYFGSLNLETIRGNFLKIAGCSIRQNYCQILCWLQKAQSMWC